MNRLIPAGTLVALALGAGCCRLFQSKEAAYKKEMECALRVTDERSIEILRRGMFCCEPLPKDELTLPAARRFYLERAEALDPNSLEPPAAIAKCYWDEGNYAEALTFFERVRARTDKPLGPAIGEFTMYRLLQQWAKGEELAAWVRLQKGIDAQKAGDYLEGRLLYDEGRFEEARPLLESAARRAEAGGDSLGDTLYTMKDVHLYLAQIRLKAGDAQGAYEDFKLFLKKMTDPQFQTFYAYWLPRIGTDQKGFYDKIENDWAHVRQ